MDGEGYLLFGYIDGVDFSCAAKRKRSFVVGDLSLCGMRFGSVKNFLCVGPAFVKSFSDAKERRAYLALRF